MFELIHFDGINISAVLFTVLMLLHHLYCSLLLSGDFLSHSEPKVKNLSSFSAAQWWKLTLWHWICFLHPVYKQLWVLSLHPTNFHQDTYETAHYQIISSFHLFRLPWSRVVLGQLINIFAVLFGKWSTFFCKY